jgi:ATP-binding cassette subfamily B (MDR/TAP) protein 1
MAVKYLMSCFLSLSVFIFVQIYKIGAFSLGSASPGIQALAIARGAAKKIFETIDRQSKVDALSEAGNRPDCFKNDIIFKNIDFRK